MYILLCDAAHYISHYDHKGLDMGRHISYSNRLYYKDIRCSLCIPVYTESEDHRNILQDKYMILLYLFHGKQHSLHMDFSDMAYHQEVDKRLEYFKFKIFK